ncbi:MAG: glycosyltransferase family 39 protein [Bacteroidetes bacterium]|nr:glycosyltransferase family 39 protein [Bacteroidota bacterium]
MATNPTTASRLSPWVYFIALFNVCLHLAFYNTLGFHRDELLYFSLGQHLNAGYASVPPFIGFIAWLMINTLGYSLFACRIIPILLGGLMVILTGAIARELKAKQYAQVLAAIAFVVTPFNLRTYMLFMPVCFDCFFWSLILFIMLRWINTRENKYLLYMGLAAGLAMLNKYLIAVELFAILIMFAFSSYRKIFLNKYFYFACLLALIVFLPNLIWQLKNNLPVLTHMHALHDNQLVHVDRIAFFTDQLFIVVMAALLVIPGLLYMGFAGTMKQYRPLFLASIISLLIIAILRGKSYYTIGLFPFWIAAGGVFWETRLKSIVSRILLPASMILFTIPILPMGIPVYHAPKLADYFAGAKRTTGFDMALRWETGRIHSLPQDYADMLGWEEIAAGTAKAYSRVPDKKSCMIYAEYYGRAGAVMVLGKKYHLPEPVCFSESFFYWFPRHPQTEIKTLIYINDELGEDIHDLFADCRLINRVSDTLAREYGTGVWLCTNPRTSFNAFWKHRIPQITDPFR